MKKEDLIGMEVVCTYSDLTCYWAVGEAYPIADGLSIHYENGGLERWGCELEDEFSIDRLNDVLSNTYTSVKFELLQGTSYYLNQLESLLNQTEYDHDDAMELIEHLKKLV